MVTVQYAMSIGKLAFVGIKQNLVQLSSEERKEILDKDYFCPISIYVSALEFKKRFNIPIQNNTMYKSIIPVMGSEKKKDVYLNVCDIDDSDYLMEIIILD